jgi:hypothetical protein
MAFRLFRIQTIQQRLRKTLFDDPALRSSPRPTKKPAKAKPTPNPTATYDVESDEPPD